MDDAIKRFRQRRSARLGFETIKHYDSVKEYRKRRAERLAARMDADGDDDSAPAPKKGGGGHGNTKLPFGLCQREGIDIQPGWTPQDAWKALEGKGYSAGEAYKELKETGKVSKKGNSAKEGATKSAPAKKDYASMDYDSIAKEYEDHIKRYKARESEIEELDGKAKRIEKAVENLKKIKDRNGYSGETYDEVSKELEFGDKNYWRYRAIKSVMDELGEDAFKKDAELIEQEADKLIDRINIQSGGGFFELNEERKVIQKAMAEKAKEKYPNISDCDSPIALEARMRADDFFDCDEWTSTVMSYSELDAKTVKGIGRAFEVIKEKFPELKGALRPMLVDNSVAEDAYAHCVTPGVGDPLVVMNRRRFRDGGGLMESLKRDVKSGFHPKGTDNFESVVTHEYGHAIDDVLTKKYANELGGRSFCKYVLDRLTENHPYEDETTLMRRVSTYAVNNKSPHGSEFLAEAFSEYCCAKHPRKIAVEVGQIMTEFIKNPKSALEPKKPKWTFAPPDDDDEDVPLF